MSEEKTNPSIHSLYKDYLKFMKMKEEMMSPTERIERKRAFVAGFTSSMRVIIDSAPDETTDEEGVTKFEEMMKSLKAEIYQYAEDSIREQTELMKIAGN